MLDSPTIVRMYENVMLYDMAKYGISEDAVRIGMESMAQVYQPGCVSLNSNRSVVADYNDPAHRCAYLHKYAAFHTAMVRDVIAEAINENYGYFHDLLFSEGSFKLCSLGGGPGSDVIGALAAFHAAYLPFNASVTVLDYMYKWSESFYSIMTELSTGWYGSFGTQMSLLPWQYVSANLLKTPSPEVYEALSTASLVTMVKFASAAACQDTENMMKNIFAAMKPGAVILFIDNSGGGFHNIFYSSAVKYDLFTVFGPIKHKTYINELTKMRKFGKVSCFKTTVHVHMLQKPRNVIYRDTFRSPSRRVLLSSPFSGARPSLCASPLTPMLFCSNNADNFTRDEIITNDRGIVSPVHLPLTPNNLPTVPSCIATPLDYGNVINSPATQSRRKKKKNRKGCLPFNNFRHRLAEKVKGVRAQARELFQKRKKENKAHPIFRL